MKLIYFSELENETLNLWKKNFIQNKTLNLLM